MNKDEALEEKISEAIKKNGNNFHLDVVDELRELGWKVLISPYYTDPAKKIPREIDIIAEKEFPVPTPDGYRNGYIVIRGA
jgi:hypothetical protein